VKIRFTRHRTPETSLPPLSRSNLLEASPSIHPTASAVRCRAADRAGLCHRYNVLAGQKSRVFETAQRTPDMTPLHPSAPQTWCRPLRCGLARPEMKAFLLHRSRIAIRPVRKGQRSLWITRSHQAAEVDDSFAALCRTAAYGAQRKLMLEIDCFRFCLERDLHELSDDRQSRVSGCSADGLLRRSSVPACGRPNVLGFRASGL
jgi:hypothetical protein